MAVSSNAIKSGEGYVLMGMDISAVEKGCKDAGKALAALGVGIAAAGAAITAPFLKGLSVLDDTARSIFETSRKTGLSFGEVQDAANGMRVGFDDLGTATKKMNQFIQQAANGSGTATEDLNRMGLTIQDLGHLSENDRLLRLADGIAGIADQSQRAAMQVAIFGRNGLALDLTGGAAGVRARAARRAEVGGVLSDDDIRLARGYTMAVDEMNASIKGVWQQIGAAAVPLMTWFSRLITDVMIAVRRWAEANRPLLQTIFAIGDKLVLVGGIVGVLGGGIIGLGATLGALSASISAIMAVVLSPFMLWAVVIAGILALGYLLYTVFPQIGEIFSGWGPAFAKAGENFKQMWQGVSDALASGDFALAGRIAMLGLELQWLRFKDFFLQIWDEMTNTVARWIAERLNINLGPDGRLTDEQRAANANRTASVFQGLTPAESQAARDEALLLGSVGSAGYDRALEDAINRRFVEQQRAIGGAFPESSYVRVQAGRVVSGGPQGARTGGTVLSARQAEINAIQEQMDLLAGAAANEAWFHEANRIADHAAGAVNDLEMQSIKGHSSGSFFADAIAGFLGAGVSPQEEANRLLAEQNRQNQAIIDLLEAIRDEIGLEYT